MKAWKISFNFVCLFLILFDFLSEILLMLFATPKHCSHKIRNLYMGCTKGENQFLFVFVFCKEKQASELLNFSQSCVKTRCVLKEWSWFENLRYKDLTNNCLVIVIFYAKGINIGITKKSNCYCLHQVVNSGTQNYVNNKEF